MYVMGKGANRPRLPVSCETCCYLHVPERKLNVFMEATTGNALYVHWMDVSLEQSSWNQTPVKLSTPLVVTPHWSTATWISELKKFIVIGVKDDTAAYYEIDIPENLKTEWKVTRRPWVKGSLATAPQAGVEIRSRRI